MHGSLEILSREDSRSRTPTPTPVRLPAGREREQQRTRTGHRREYDPRQDKRSFEQRVEGAVADVGMYRNISYRDLNRVALRRTSLHGAAGRGPHDTRRPYAGAQSKGAEGRHIQSAHRDRGRGAQSARLRRRAGIRQRTANLDRSSEAWRVKPRHRRLQGSSDRAAAP